MYLLDHQYTTRGIGWSHLKGVDVQRVGALDAAQRGRVAARSVLALADVHETWSAYAPDDPYGRGRLRPDDEYDDDGSAYELEDLLESSVSLS